MILAKHDQDVCFLETWLPAASSGLCHASLAFSAALVDVQGRMSSSLL